MRKSALISVICVRFLLKDKIMVILTLNCGSSSAKYQVYDWDNKEVMANGVVERIGIEGSCITHKAKGQKTEIESPCPTHKEAIELIIK